MASCTRHGSTAHLAILDIGLPGRRNTGRRSRPPRGTDSDLGSVSGAVLHTEMIVDLDHHRRAIPHGSPRWRHAARLLPAPMLPLARSPLRPARTATPATVAALSLSTPAGNRLGRRRDRWFPILSSPSGASPLWVPARVDRDAYGRRVPECHPRARYKRPPGRMGPMCGLTMYLGGVFPATMPADRPVSRRPMAGEELRYRPTGASVDDLLDQRAGAAVIIRASVRVRTATESEDGGFRAHLAGSTDGRTAPGPDKSTTVGRLDQPESERGGNLSYHLQGAGDSLCRIAHA